MALHRLILVEMVTGRGGRWAAKLVSVMERRRTRIPWDVTSEWGGPRW